jgi:hypothetical protein
MEVLTLRADDRRTTGASDGCDSSWILDKGQRWHDERHMYNTSLIERRRRGDPLVVHSASGRAGLPNCVSWLGFPVVREYEGPDM